MYYDDHNPPHFHVRYNEFRAVMDIQSLNVVHGMLPARVRAPVEEWAEMNREELLAMWVSKRFHKVSSLV
jgi:diadenosine tetraphosphate (Ap4A) HIT family hydrolase